MPGIVNLNGSLGSRPFAVTLEEGVEAGRTSELHPTQDSSGLATGVTFGGDTGTAVTFAMVSGSVTLDADGHHGSLIEHLAPAAGTAATTLTAVFQCPSGE